MDPISEVKTVEDVYDLLARHQDPRKNKKIDYLVRGQVMSGVITSNVLRNENEGTANRLLLQQPPSMFIVTNTDGYRWRVDLSERQFYICYLDNKPFDLHKLYKKYTDLQEKILHLNKQPERNLRFKSTDSLGVTDKQ